MAYDGFISYSHAADGRLAPALQGGLQQLAKPWNSRRALRVFRDETGLSTNPHLWSAIETALDESAWFVLLASPEAAGSEWVNKEVAHWLATKPVERILPVVMDGTWEWDPGLGDFTQESSAVPPALRGVLRDEPRHLDVRWARAETDLDLRNSRFRGAVADLAAPMHGIAKDELEGEDIRQHRRTRRLARGAVAALVALVVVALITTGVAVNKSDQANHNAAVARREAAVADAARTMSDATALASQARVLPVDQLDLALLLAVLGRRLNESTTTDGALEVVLSSVPIGVGRVVDSGALTTLCSDMSPDGRLLAVGGADGTARVVDTASGRVVRSLPGNTASNLVCVRFSADGTRLAGGDANGDVFVWDIATGRQLGEIHTGRYSTVPTFVGDDRVVTSTDLGVVTVWDISDPGHPAAIGAPYAGSFLLPGLPPSPPRTFLALGSHLLAFDDAGHTDVWDITTHTRAYAPLPGWAVGESSDGSTLATAAGGQVLLWDLATGQPRGHPLDGFASQRLWSVLFSRDGQRAAIALISSNGGVNRGTVTVVDLPSGARVGNPVPGQTMRYLDDGRVAVGVGQTILLWRPDDVAPVPFATMLDGAHTPGLAHWLSPTTVYGLPGSWSGSLAFAVGIGPAPEWDASTGEPVGDLLGPLQPAAAAMLGDDRIVKPDGTLAALGEGDEVELWDTSQDRRAALFDPGQRQPLATWDPVAPILATTGLGGTLALWDISDVAHPTLLARATVPGYTATTEPHAHFSPDGHTIAVGTLFIPVISLVSVPDARVQHVLRTTNTFNSGTVFKSDSKTVAAVQLSFTGNARVILWDVATGRQRSALTMPFPELASAAFVNGDRWLMTVQSAQIRSGVSPDQVRASRVDLWEVATSRQVGEPIMVSGDAAPVEVDRPGGSRLLSATSVPTGTYMVWDLDPANWASIACGIAGRNLTQAEWKEYLPDRSYQATCPQWPAGT